MFSKMSFRDERNMSGNRSSDSPSPGSPLWSSPSPLWLHAKVPFSWEYEPGVPNHKSSVRATQSKLAVNIAGDNYHELRPPPLLSRSSEAVGNYQSARSRHKFKKAVQVEVESGALQRDDPFMVALLECTKQQYDDKISVKASEGNNYNKKDTMWFHLSSIFSCTGSSCLTSSSHVSLPSRVVAKPEKLIRQDRARTDLIQRRPKGKMSDHQIFDVPETRNYSDFHAQKQRGLINNLSEGLVVESADLQIRCSSAMAPVGYGE
jgi:hypothetical protein